MPIRLASIRSGIGENMEDRYLFKAKHIHVLPNNNHLDGSWVVGFLSGERYIANDSGEYLIDPSTICQCTGLKDKNGKLIWENDIVKINNSKVNTVITFRDFEIICTIPNEKYYKRRLEYDTEYEVIGNVFDNPELLEVQE